MRLGCLFVLVPVTELALLIWMGREMGVWPTLSLVVGTGFLGAALARREGMRTLIAIQQELAEGRLPTRSLLAGGAVLVGGAFLLTPGVLTDLAGFLLLFSPTRALVFRWVQRRMKTALTRGTLQTSVWNARGFENRKGGGWRVWTTGKEAHGRGAGFPFEFQSRSEEGREETEDEHHPPRPGEIIQE